MKVTGPMIFSQNCLACGCLKNYEKNMENFPRSPKYDAKDWAIEEIESFEIKRIQTKW